MNADPANDVHAHQAVLVSPHHPITDPTTYTNRMKHDGKDFVLTVMDYRIYNNDDNLGPWPIGKKMLWVGCPNCKDGEVYRFSHTKPLDYGYKIPSNHFNSCVGSARGVAKIVQERMEDKEQEKLEDQRSISNGKAPPIRTQQTLENFNFMPSPNVLSLYMWLTLIVILNMPICDVECSDMRDCVLNNCIKSAATVIETGHHLVEIVEKKIAAMMNTAPAGQLLFDGYSFSGNHYVAIYCSFIRKYKVTVNGIEHTLEKHELRLLAVGPLPPIDEDSGEEESIEFNAEAHLNYFRLTLEIYGKNFDDFIFCHCADNAAVNIRIANLSHGLHGSCKSHCLALEGAKMCEAEGPLKEMISKITACSAHVRNSCKVSTAVRNKAAAIDPRLANVTAKGESTTRQWLGAAMCMKAHKSIQPVLEQLAKDKVGRMRDHSECLSMNFMDNMEVHYKYMRQIRGCSEALQKRGRTLGDCQNMLDMLRARVEKGENDYMQCNLGVKYIKPANGLSTSPAFETGIAKIQGGIGEERTMTQAEKAACKRFKINATVESESESDSVSDHECFLKQYEKTKKRKERIFLEHSDYINCNFVMGSAAVVETLWSVFDAFNTKRRRGTSPITNEMILFLKENKDLWGVEDVHQANLNRLSANKNLRVEKKMAEHAEMMANNN